MRLGEFHLAVDLARLAAESYARLGMRREEANALRLELDAGDLPISASVLCPGAINTQIVFSKRNRDAESAKEHRSSAQEEAFEKHAGALLAKHGKDPSEVADRVMAAIVNTDFWILTHSDWKKVMQERVAALVNDNSLYTGFGG